MYKNKVVCIKKGSDEEVFKPIIISYFDNIHISLGIDKNSVS